VLLFFFPFLPLVLLLLLFLSPFLSLLFFCVFATYCSRLLNCLMRPRCLCSLSDPGLCLVSQVKPVRAIAHAHPRSFARAPVCISVSVCSGHIKLRLVVAVCAVCSSCISAASSIDGSCPCLPGRVVFLFCLLSWFVRNFVFAPSVLKAVFVCFLFFFFSPNLCSPSVC
jgi:hypothetical protein